MSDYRTNDPSGRPRPNGNGNRTPNRRRRRRRRRLNPGFVMLVASLVLIVILIVSLCVRCSRKDPENGTDPVVTSDNAPENTRLTVSLTEKGEAPVTEPVETEPVTEATEPVVIERIEVEGDIQQYDAVLRVGNAAFEYYSYSDSAADVYADAVNSTAKLLKGESKVYSILIPLSSAITLPDDLVGEYPIADQKEAQSNLQAKLDADVISVPIYDTLMQHRTEYVYYRTDHHWTGLGAYYAYLEYCKAAELEPNALEDYFAEDFDGFLGTFYNDTNKNSQLAANPDTVTAYNPICGAERMTMTDNDGNTGDWPIIYNESTAPAGLKYGAYICGDNQYSEIKNPTLTDGSACILIKESFGNAFAPFLVDHYETTYVIDYRYWHGNLAIFAREHNVDDIIFCNNLSAVRSKSLMGRMQNLFEE